MPRGQQARDSARAKGNPGSEELCPRLPLRYTGLLRLGDDFVGTGFEAGRRVRSSPDGPVGTERDRAESGFHKPPASKPRNLRKPPVAGLVHRRKKRRSRRKLMIPPPHKKTLDDVRDDGVPRDKVA